MIDGLVASPPYADLPMNPGESSRPEAKIARLLAEGKVREVEVIRIHGRGAACNLRQQDYGHTKGQLGAMKGGALPLPEGTMNQETTREVPTVEWSGCYDDSWKGLIVPNAFAHPAKAARGLLCRILDFMLAEGWLKKGGLVLDPFSGVGTTGIEAASRGLRFVGVELEERFVGWARESFALHARTWVQFGDPLPVILEGDSRKLSELLAGAGLLGKRGTSCVGGSMGGTATGESLPSSGHSSSNCDSSCASDVAAVVSSPPYAETVGRGQVNIDFSKVKEGLKAPTAARLAMGESYGHTPGQLGGMTPGSVEGVVSSPPYADQNMDRGKPGPEEKIARLLAEGKIREAEIVRRHGSGAASNLRQPDYGTTPGQLGGMKAADLVICDSCGILISDTQQPQDSHAYYPETLSNGPGVASSPSVALGIPASGAACADGTSCGPVRTAASNSPATASRNDASSVLTRSTPDSADSPKKGPSTRPCSRGETTTGKAEASGGADVPGLVKNDSPVNGTETGASSAASAGQSESSTSTTSSGRRRQAASGITHSKTCKRSAVPVTPGPTDLAAGKPVVLCAACAARSSSPERATPLSARRNAAVPVGERRTISARQGEGAMPPGSPPAADGVVVSPPYEGNRSGGDGYLNREKKTGDKYAEWERTEMRDPETGRYLPSPNLGLNGTPQTFWEAAAQILRETHAVLSPGAVTAWIVKDFVRAKKRMPFTQDWARLLGACGFEVFLEARALLTKTDSHPGLFGEPVVKKTERASFFRRLATKKGAPPILWESVLFARRR